MNKKGCQGKVALNLKKTGIGSKDQWHNGSIGMVDWLPISYWMIKTSKARFIEVDFHPGFNFFKELELEDQTLFRNLPFDEAFFVTK